MNMINSIGNLLPFAIMTALIMGSMYYFLVAFRELRDGNMVGLLHFMFAVLFAAGHFYLLTDNYFSDFKTAMMEQPGFWYWLLALGAPATIALYVLFGLSMLGSGDWREFGMRIGLGMALVGLLYYLGSTWAVDIRGFIILFWAALWFRLELRMAVD